VTRERTTNWGRWGEADQVGALNVVTPQSRLEALTSVRTGAVHSLSYVLGRETSPSTTSRNPVWHTTTINRKRNGIGIADDVLTMHSHTGTHLDALCHYWGDDGLYNGFEQSEIVSHGAPHLSIDQVQHVVTGAVLIDVSEHTPAGRDALGWEVGVEHLSGALDRAGLELRPGDAVLVNTGWGAMFRDDPDLYNWGEPGIGAEAAEWLAGQDVVLVGADSFAVEAIPPRQRGKGLPVHQLLLNRYGVYILENLKLVEAVAAEGTSRGVLVLAPLLIGGGCGSPVNPLFIV
jgi:kynurenine formamidase